MILLWIINALFIILIAWFLSRTINDPEIKPYFFPALFLKFAAGIAVGILYYYYYREGDTIRFHNLSVSLHDWGAGNLKSYLSFLISGNTGSFIPDSSSLAEEPRTLFFVKFLSLINFISGGNYWLNGFYLSLMSFTGTWLVIREMSRMDGKFLFPALISFALLPTMVFWSSGVLKESLSVFCMGLMISVFLRCVRTNSLKLTHLIFFIVACWAYWNIKYYLAAVLVVTMLSIGSASYLHSKIRGISGPVWVTGLFVCFTLAATILHPNFSLLRIFDVLNENHYKILEISGYKNVIPFIPVRSPMPGFWVNLPVSLFAGLFMPLPFQGSSLIILLPGMINLSIILLSVYFLSGKIVWPSGKMRLLLTGAILYIFILSVMLSWSTPNFGTLERYKVSYLPVYVLILLAGVWPRLSAKFKLIQKT